MKFYKLSDLLIFRINLAYAPLLALLLGCCMPPSVAQCPCWQASDGPVTCEDPSTTSMPSCVLSNVQQLYLNNNLIPIVKDTFINFPNLVKLWIQNRELDLVAEDAFVGPGASLQSLVISGTSLRYISPQVFYNTPNLQVLDIKNNKISFIPQDAFTLVLRCDGASLNT